MSQILPHFFVSNPRTRQEYYKLVKAEILKLAPNICYFIQLLRLDIAIVKSYYRLSSVPKICFVIALTSSWILLLLTNVRKVNARGCFIGFWKLSFIHLSTTHFDLNKSLQIQFTGHFCSLVQFNTNILYTRHIFHTP